MRCPFGLEFLDVHVFYGEEIHLDGAPPPAKSPLNMRPIYDLCVSTYTTNIRPICVQIYDHFTTYVCFSCCSDVGVRLEFSGALIGVSGVHLVEFEAFVASKFQA